MSRDGYARRYAPPRAPRALVLLVAGACLLATQADAAVGRAGPDQTVSPSATVVLDGSASTADDGSALSYAWTQIAGPAVTLADSAAASTSFSAPTPAAEWVVLTFELKVTEDSGASAADTVTVMVSESLTPQNFLKVVSPPGEIVGQGESFEMTFDAASIVISSNAESIAQIVVSNLPVGVSPLRLTLARSDEQPLTVGRYEFTYRNGTPAGVDSLWVHRGLSCGDVFGNFIIHDIGRDDTGAITRIAVDFKQYCVNYAGAPLPLTGYLRFNSVVPVLSRLPIASAGKDLTVIPGQVVTLSSDTSWPGSAPVSTYRWRRVGGPVVAGIPSNDSIASFVAPDVNASGNTLEVELIITNTDGAVSTDRVRVHVLGADERKTFVYIEVEDTGIGDWVFGTGAWLFDTNFGRHTMQTYEFGGTRIGFQLSIAELNNWNISFTKATSGQLQAGIYPNTQPSSTQAYPYLSVGGAGHGYNRTYGAVVIHEIEFAADGTITSLAMDFQYRGDAGPRITGVVRYNSTVAFVAQDSVASAGADQSAVGGDYVGLGPESSYIGSTPVVDVSWTQVSGPPVQLLVLGDSKVFFDAPPEGGVFTFELTIRTGDGRVSTSRVTVTVAPAGTLRSAMVIRGEQGEPLTFGQTISEPLEELSLRNFHRLNFVEVLLGSLTGSFPTAPDQAYLLMVPPRPEPFVIGNLVPGTYEDTRWYRQTHDMTDRGVMVFDVNGLGCIRPRGRFVLHELELAEYEVTRMAVDLQQTCDPTGRYLIAQIRINSAIPIRASLPLVTAGKDLVVRAGRGFLLDGLGSGSWTDQAPSYAWRQVSGTAINFSQPGSRTTFATPAALAAGQSVATAELEVADAFGNRSSDRVDITVLGADQPSTEFDVVRARTSSGTVVAQTRHDPNNAYITTGGGISLRTRYVRSVSEHILALELEASIADQIPTGGRRVINGGATDIFGFQTVRIALAEADEFNDFTRCDQAGGALRVAEAEFTPDAFTRLAIDFNLDCPDGFTYRGSTRFNSAVPVEPGRVFADAGPDHLASETATVTLDGRASLIVQEAIASYRWRQLSGPGVALTPTGPGQATFTVPQLSANVNMQFELEVTGEQGQTGTDTLTIQAEDSGAPPPPPPPGGGGGGGGAVPLGQLLLLCLMSLVSTRRRSAAHRC